MKTVEYRIVGLPKNVDTDELEARVEELLEGTVVESQYMMVCSNNRRTIALLTVETNHTLFTGARLLRTSRLDGIPLHVELSNNNETTTKKSRKSNENKLAEDLAVPFYNYIKEDPTRLERASDRDEVSTLFREYYPSGSRRLEVIVMLRLREKKLVRSKRYGDKVVVTFAQEEPGDFPAQSDAKERVLKNRMEQEENKHGVVVSEAEGLPDILPPSKSIEFSFQLESQDSSVELRAVVVTGPQKKAFTVDNSILPLVLSGNNDDKVRVVFSSTGIGLYRGVIRMKFANDAHDFVIVRHLTVRSGDKSMDDILKPTAPYQKRKKKFERPPTNIVGPPKTQEKPGSFNPFGQLPHHKIPSEIRQLIMSRDLEYDLERPDNNVSLYGKFWQEMLWASEYQAYEDIKLYDMERVQLKHEGRFVVLQVPGLAEGRPSVLRGDLVNVTWKGKLYKGRVVGTRLLEVLMELGGSFHDRFNQALDTVDVRFTLSRTTFRTSHEGCSKALVAMGEHMLVPKQEHDIFPFDRSVPLALKWANRNLNDEQRATVFQIVKGGRRPLPYIVFGPPGTGEFSTACCGSRCKTLILTFTVCCI